MAQVQPIRGLRYTPEAGPLGALLSPPYDVIGPQEQRELAARNPCNAVHLELTEDGGERYSRVAERLQRWIGDGLLRRDEQPNLYVYEQGFREAGRTLIRRGLLAGVEAQPWEEGAVRPHEFTMSAPKEDRLRLLEATRTQFSPVFLLARDRAGQLAQFIDRVASREPDVVGEVPGGDSHRLWAVEAGRAELRMLAPLFAESFYVADGHHRYETAVLYRKGVAEREGQLARDHPARFALSAIVPASDPGLVIRPIHRFVPRRAPGDWRQRLAGLFEIIHFKEPVGVAGSQVRELEMFLQAEPGAILALGLEPEQAFGLKLLAASALRGRLPAGRSAQWGAVPANVLRYGVLEPLWGIDDADLESGAVEYSHDAAEVYDRAYATPESTTFLLAPIKMEEMMALADRGERLPQKTTFFYPKLATGTVFHPLYP